MSVLSNNRSSKWQSTIWLSLILCAPLTAHAQQIPSTLYQGMQWRFVGPYRGGRSLTATGVRGNPHIYYFGAVAGGVWKTTDGGQSWSSLFDKQSVSSIGGVAVAPSDPNVLYVGTGEACIRGDSSFGDGVYKSTDAGNTWKHIGLDDTRQIGRVIVDPKDPNIVFVAALGHSYGPNQERGVFRSTDGGNTWTKVLYKDDKSGAIDIVFDPDNSRILYASLWQVERTPWSLVSGGPGSGLYKSVDGGSTWKELRGQGLPDGMLGRIGVSVSGADSNRVYALIEAHDGGLFRSDNGGESWTRTNPDFDLRGRPWYYSHVFADPKNADTVYAFSFGAYRSIDGGKTFTPITTPHGDYHDLWIDPDNPQRMIIANDGGATISTDGGKHWTPEDNQPTGQFYHIATDNLFNYQLYGSQQDSGTVAIPSRTNEGSIARNDHYWVGGGESGYILPSPLDPDIVYAGSLYSTFTRFDKRTGIAKDISPWPVNLLNQPAADARFRLGWTAPMQISPHDPHVLYIGAQMLLKTSDDGMNWQTISPDLTRNDKTKQQSSGGPITQDNTTVEYFDQLSTIVESSLEKGLIWAGSDDGLIHLTRDGGKNWSNVTPEQLPELSMVSLIDASTHDAGTAYAAVDAHKLDDFRPYIYKTSNYGKTWTPIVNGIPSNAYVHAVREDPAKKGLLYAGTETGVYVSFDDGGNWQSLQLNLPTTPIYDLTVHGDDLAVATHGRAFWILGNLGPLRQSADATNSDFFLYKPSIAYRTESGAQGAPPGAVLDYYLKTAPQATLTLEILDDAGKSVRGYDSAPAKPASPEATKSGHLLKAQAGMNRFLWNLKTKGIGGADDEDSGFRASEGPLVVPGLYKVRLTTAGKSQTVPLEIKEDPRVNVSQDDLKKQFDLALQIQDRLKVTRSAVAQMKQLRLDLDAIDKRLKDDQQTKSITTAAEDLKKKTLAIEDSVTGWKVEPGRYALNYPPALDDQLASLSNYVSMADGAPGTPFYQVFTELNHRLDQALGAWDQLRTRDLAALNDLIKRQNVPAISITDGNEEQ